MTAFSRALSLPRPWKLATGAALIFSLSPFLAYAQPNPSIIPLEGVIGRCSFITGEFHFDCIPLYVAYLIKTLFGFAGGICLMQIIFGGYKVMFSGFSELGFGEKEKGKQQITSALVGLAFTVLAFLIVDMIVTVLVSGPT